MITVTVRYHNLLRRMTGVKEETISLPVGASLRDALEHLAQRHGPALQEMLFEPDGGISVHLVIFRNRQLVRPDQHDAPLTDGEELMLFPAIAGG
ncbi:MAG: MoaD/ThiS family protein [Anaerolineae bacterium]|nr:MoaD/ThiS family protein [Anaerolineae bacterium]